MLKLLSLLSPLFINLFGAIILLATSNKNYKNRFYLGLFFANSFIIFTGHFLSFLKYWELFKYIDFLFLSALLAFYPLFYLFIKSAFNYNILSPKNIYHFIPSIVVGILMLATTVYTGSKSYTIYMNNNLYNSPINNNGALILAFIYKGSRAFHLLQILFYNFITIKYIIAAKKNIHNSFSNLDKYQEKYFYIVTVSFILLMSIPGFFVTFIGRTPFISNDIMLFLVTCIFTLLYIILAVIGIQQKPSESHFSDFEINDELNHNNELLELEQHLIEYFNKEKPWLNPDLNIWDVAKNIGTNRSYVSKIINENLGSNFNQFVNNYRIEEAKELLKKSPERTIGEISELSGFGSVNSFIRIFKQTENCTPTKFKKS
ncbi:AraC family transcriptional regulator [Lutibacter sp. B1]|uniref:helix-turn-helix domain-containing protein n=1 Tax=Lutibacter sp. B1 TaxID=2725996 RepID=UPI0014574B88|nr:helix-turn-helix domain-containing protein [Lutibacter sp. B1]NLP56580.1 helix-turn-helix transcriptional regulator [Lutibacter sp. B1]